MSDFLQDTWHDLREKRLWPVAALLALAVVAIPALLTKSAAQPASEPPAAVAPQQTDEATVELDDSDAASTGAGSSLDEFAAGDPFTPPDAIVARSEGSDSATAGGGASADGGGSTGAAPGGDTDGGGGTLPEGLPGPPVEVPPPSTRTETAQYEYVADVTFWTGDRRRERRGMRKLDMLPNQSAPVLIFMGTEGDGGNAVFLVDSTLRAAGEGHCVPSPANCAYVHLGPGSEHSFTTEQGDSYGLRVDEIRRVEVKSSAARASRSAAQSSADSRQAARRFQLPSLVDLVAVTETTTVPGTGASPESRSSDPANGR